MKRLAFLGMVVVVVLGSLGCGGSRRDERILREGRREWLKSDAYWSSDSIAEIERNEWAREIAWVAETYMHSAARGDLKTAEQLSTPMGRPQARWMRLFKGSANARIVELYATDDRALAVSSVIYENKNDEPGQLVMSLTHTRNRWLIASLDFESQPTVERSIRTWAEEVERTTRRTDESVRTREGYRKRP